MSWRDILVGALVTLVVTVLAGVVVWWLTRESGPAVEKLVYSIEQVASLPLNDTQLNVITLRITNRGNKAAHEARYVAEFPTTYEISEKQTTSSAGPLSAFSDVSTGKQVLVLTINTLAPSETITASLLVRGRGTPIPRVGLRSAESIGSEVSQELVQKHSPKELGKVESIILILLALIVQALLLIISKRIRALTGESPNNIAFVLCHKKLPNEAARILDKQIYNGRACVYELANYALAVGLNGQVDTSEKYFQAAEWWSHRRINKNAEATISFNRAALALSLGKFDEAKTFISRALELSRNTILRYCEVSEYMREGEARNEDFRAILNQARM